MSTIAPLDLNSHCLSAGFINDNPYYALADGTVHWLDNGHKTIEVQDGMVCCALAQDNKSLISGGEDGRVCRFTRDGTVEELTKVDRKWITAIAAGPHNSVAYASGRTAWVRTSDGNISEFNHPRSAEALAFAPKGLRLAVARYNGATLHWAAATGTPVELEWKGAHVGICFSPDGRFLVTSMQENALHGWRLEDGRNMRMTGYPAKIKDWSWSAKGKWLATSGAPAAVVWPFTGKDGPMGKAPLELGLRGDTMVTSVACHPVEDIVAVGYQDGMVMLCRFADQKEVLLRRSGQSAISSMGWDNKGERLAYGSESGDCGLINIKW